MAQGLILQIVILYTIIALAIIAGMYGLRAIGCSTTVSFALGCLVFVLASIGMKVYLNYRLSKLPK